jgi:hypothetical protein
MKRVATFDLENAGDEEVMSALYLYLVLPIAKKLNAGLLV